MPVTEVFFQPLQWRLFKFPPDDDPLTLPPPQSEPGLLTPFNIDAQLYNEMLKVSWPIIIALVYAVTVSFLNQVNKARNNKPWAISRTSAFTFFVLAHNIFLTVYSAWTFVGMLGALRRSFDGITDNYSEYGMAPVVDALCKMSGPRGIGQAATWEPFYGQWNVKNQAIKLLNGNPDPTDVGRLWNEGLAFYGWLFYLSKFYEVLDTVIILAKGKRSSLLQTYHHAGAMMCMWAGIRYMSPPIWMFVQFNSGVHALMYFYYTLAALGVKVPNKIKRTLTSLQISQFIIGANFAFSHLVVAYNVPANTPYIFSHGVASAVSTAASSVASALPTVAAGWGPWLKKAVLRAVGDEGLAENVRGPSGGRFGIDALKAEISDNNLQEIRYRMEYPAVHCLDTSGQAFAIWLNVVYLLPLTYLFGAFFVTSYLKRAQAEKKTPGLPQRMVRSGSDAAKGVDREIRQAMGDKQGYNSPIDDEFAIELQEEIDRSKEQIKDAAAAIKDEAVWLAGRVQEKTKPAVNGTANRMAEIKNEVKEETEPILAQVQTKVIEAKSEVQEKAPKLVGQAKNKAQDAAATVKEEAPKAAQATQQKAQDAATTVKENVPQIAESTKRSAAQVKEEATGNIPRAAESVKDTAKKTSTQAQEQVHQAQNDGAADAEHEENDAHVKPGESYADAVKQEPEHEEHSGLDESAVEVTWTEAESLEVNPDEILSRSELVAERTEGQQPVGESDGSADGSSLFG